jgi:hypothetical protein
VEFLDLDAKWHFLPEDFRDYIHYSPVGAEKYTARFSDEVLVPLLRELEGSNQ